MITFAPNRLFRKMWDYYHLNKGKDEVVTICNEGSSRSGKSYDMYHLMYAICDTVPVRKSPWLIYVVRDTLKAARDIAYKTDFVDCFKKMGVYDSANARGEGSTPEYNLFGSRIVFVGMDGDNELGSSNWIFFNEMLDNENESRVNDWIMRCTDMVTADWNPKLTTHFVFKWQGRPNVMFTKSTFFHNRHVSKNFYNKACGWCPWDLKDYDKDNSVWLVSEAERTPNQFNIDNGTVDAWRWKVYGEGIRCAPDGAIFPDVVWVSEFPKDCEEVYFGLDFGYKVDPTALVKVGRRGNELFIEYLVYSPFENVAGLWHQVKPFLEEEVNSRLSKSMVEISCDSASINSSVGSESAGVDYVSYLADMCSVDNVNAYFFKTQKTFIMDGIFTMKKFKLHVVLSEQSETEFKNYIYDVKHGETRNKPIDKFNHGIDAARYAVVDNWAGWL